MRETNERGLTGVGTLLQNPFGEGRDSGPNVLPGKFARLAPVE